MPWIGAGIRGLFAFARWVVLLVLGVAILMGTRSRPSDAHTAREGERSANFRRLDDRDHARVVMPSADGQDTSHLVILDPTGRQALFATYHRVSGLTVSLARSGPLRTCGWLRPDGGVAYCADTYNGHAELQVGPDGSGALRVFDKDGRRPALTEIRISAQGEPSVVPAGP